MFLTDTLAKVSQNISAYYFVSEHFKHFFSGAMGVDPTSPPPRPLRLQVFFTYSHSYNKYSETHKKVQECTLNINSIKTIKTSKRELSGMHPINKEKDN